MKIDQLEENTKVINLVGEITSLEPMGQTPGGVDYQEGILSDDTGQVRITFWGDQVGNFALGDKIVLNGWCKKFQEELQVSSGKFGKITKIPPVKQG